MSVPTVGLGSDVEQISGGADVREIDTSEVESIVMIGDSITVGALPFLEDKFEELGFDDVTIVAEEGKRSSKNLSDNPSGADVAAFVSEGSDGEVGELLWIVALGTNDISAYSSVDDIVTEMETIVASIPDDAPLIWVDTYIEDRPQDTADVNAAIDQIVEDRSNATIGRWAEIAPTDGVLRSDGVHPNDDGARVFAALVTATVSDFLER